MKVTKIFGLVLLFHVGAIGLILFQPGCQTRPPPPPPPGVATATGVSAPPTAPRAERAAYTPAKTPQAPTRPAATNAYSGGDDDLLDPAFNAGIEPLSSGQPMLEPSVSLDEDTTMATEPSPEPVETETYKVVAGDNLSKIARSFGVTIAELKAANDLDSSTIYVGQELVVPTPSAPVATSTLDAAGSKTYTVQSGDSLSVIASRHGVTIAELKSANALTSNLIRVGDKLYIPEGGAPAPKARASSTPVPSSNGATYTVKSGDTPGGIAQKYGIDYRELMRLNGISDPSKLRVGQVLIIPGVAGSSTPAPASTTRTSTAATTPRPTPATSTPSRPTQLTPQPSRPATISSEPASGALTPEDELDLLESSDLPLMDVEVVEPDASGSGGDQ